MEDELTLQELALLEMLRRRFQVQPPQTQVSTNLPFMAVGGFTPARNRINLHPKLRNRQTLAHELGHFIDVNRSISPAILDSISAAVGRQGASGSLERGAISAMSGTLPREGNNARGQFVADRFGEILQGLQAGTDFTEALKPIQITPYSISPPKRNDSLNALLVGAVQQRLMEISAAQNPMVRKMLHLQSIIQGTNPLSVLQNPSTAFTPQFKPAR